MNFTAVYTCILYKIEISLYFISIFCSLYIIQCKVLNNSYSNIKYIILCYMIAIGISKTASSIALESGAKIVSEFVAGTNVVVYNRPWKGKNKVKPFIIAKGVISGRPIDGKRYVSGENDVSANLTSSRKEVNIKQLISADIIIPKIKNYYPEGTKFSDKFDLRYCFDCMIAETNLLIDETGIDDDNDEMEEAGEEESGEEFSSLSENLLQIGTDQEIRLRIEMKARESAYIDRDDGHIGLHFEYAMGDNYDDD